jgi:hypothetical protein
MIEHHVLEGLPPVNANSNSFPTPLLSQIMISYALGCFQKVLNIINLIHRCYASGLSSLPIGSSY